MDLSEPPNNARFIQIVRRHLQFDPISRGEANPPLAHFAADGGEHHVFIVEFHAEHRSRQDDRNDAFNFNMIFFHVYNYSKTAR